MFNKLKLFCMKDELKSLNSEITEFDLVQLEERLETDALAIGGLVDLATTDQLPLLQLANEECSPHCSGSACLYH